MTLLRFLSRSLSRARRPFRPTLETLEDRTQPSGFAGLGSAAGFGVLALPNTAVKNSNVTVTGDVGVSQGGKVTNMAPSTITGNVYASAAGQYSGPGKLFGSVVVDPAFIAQADADALSAASEAAALAPTQTLGTVSSPTTVNGNGGLNVIAVNGDLKNTLVLNGTASDVFVVNVSGTLTFGGNAVLGLSGGVTADHVLYNFTGAGGNITSKVGNVFNGTLLAPKYSFNLDGVFNGEIVGGYNTITLLSGAKVNEVPFAPPTSQGISLSGGVFVDSNGNGSFDTGEGVGGVLITLMGTDLNGSAVNLTTTTDASGHYKFENLMPGTYSLTQTPPFFLTGSSASPGTVGGNAEGSPQGATAIVGISLNPGDVGVDFNFIDVAGGG